MAPLVDLETSAIVQQTRKEQEETTGKSRVPVKSCGYRSQGEITIPCNIDYWWSSLSLAGY